MDIARYKPAQNCKTDILESADCGFFAGGANANIEEGVEAGHVMAHVAGPFKDLGTDVDQEDIRVPAAKNHDIGCEEVGQEEGHGGTRANGLVVNIHVVQSQRCLCHQR